MSAGDRHGISAALEKSRRTFPFRRAFGANGTHIAAHPDGFVNSCHIGTPMYFRIFSTWRLIAAILVVIYHFTHNGPDGHQVILARLERLMPMLDMFFMISGILIFVHYRDKVVTAAGYWNYLFRRFTRLYPLHLATVSFFAFLAFGVYFGWFAVRNVNPGDLYQLPAHLLLIHAWGGAKELSLNYVSWSLSAEWFCYLLLPVIVLAWRRAGTKGLLIMLAAYVGFLEIMTWSGLMPFKSWMRADTWGAWRAFADFIAGAAIACAAAQSSWTLRSHLVPWAVLISAIIALQLDAPPYLGMLMIMAALYLAAVCERNAPEKAYWLDIFAPAATVSFGIYLLHPVVEVITYNLLWPKVFAPLGMNFYVFMPVPVALSVLLAWCSFHWYERWAARRLNDALTAAPSPLQGKVARTFRIGAGNT